MGDLKLFNSGESNLLIKAPWQRYSIDRHGKDELLISEDEVADLILDLMQWRADRSKFPNEATEGSAHD